MRHHLAILLLAACLSWGTEEDLRAALTSENRERVVAALSSLQRDPSSASSLLTELFHVAAHARRHGDVSILRRSLGVLWLVGPNSLERVISTRPEDHEFLREAVAVLPLLGDPGTDVLVSLLMSDVPTVREQVLTQLDVVDVLPLPVEIIAAASDANAGAHEFALDAVGRILSRSLLSLGMRLNVARKGSEPGRDRARAHVLVRIQRTWTDLALQSLEAWSARLQRDDLEQAASYAEIVALSRLSTPPIVETLTWLLGSDSVMIQLATLEAIACVGPRAAATAPRVRELMRSPDGGVRAMATLALGAIRPDDGSIIEELMLLLGHPISRICDNAVSTLGSMRGHQDLILKKLKSLTVGENKLVQAYGLKGLWRAGADAADVLGFVCSALQDYDPARVSDHREMAAVEVVLETVIEMGANAAPAASVIGELAERSSGRLRGLAESAMIQVGVDASRRGGR